MCARTCIATFTWPHSADVESWFARVSGVQSFSEYQEDGSGRQILSNRSSLFELIQVTTALWASVSPLMIGHDSSAWQGLCGCGWPSMAGQPWSLQSAVQFVQVSTVHFPAASDPLSFLPSSFVNFL